jgi:isopenicillin N synthase-like dioxygenase
MAEQRTFMKIDLSDYDNRKDQITQDLMKACTEQGFFYGKHIQRSLQDISNVLKFHTVINHGLPVADIRTMFQASHDFFALPDDLKAHTPMDKSRNAGWEKLAQVSRVAFSCRRTRVAILIVDWVRLHFYTTCSNVFLQRFVLQLV